MDLSGWINELHYMRTNMDARLAKGLQAGTPYPPAQGVLIVRRPHYPSPVDWYALMPYGQWWDLWQSSKGWDR